MLGGAGIILGFAVFGYRVMRLVAIKVKTLTPTQVIAVHLAMMTMVLSCSILGLLISAKHTLIGAILDVGMMGEITAVRFI